MFPTPVGSAAPRQPITSPQPSQQGGAASAQADSNPVAKRNRSPSPPLPSSPTARKMEMELRGQIDKKVKLTAQAAASNAAAARSDKTGLAHPDTIDDFVAQMKAVEADWDAKTPEAKIEHFQKTIKSKFEEAGMPAPRIALMPAGGGRSGEFKSADWSLCMTSASLEKPMAEVAGTAYHEARHAQQFFMIAKYIAKNAIAPPPGAQIPQHILAAAAKAQKESPLTHAEADEAKAYHTSLYGAGATRRNHTLTRLGIHTLDRLAKKSTAFKDAGAARQTAVDKFDNYKNAQGPAFQNDVEVRKRDTTHMENHNNKKAAATDMEAARQAFVSEKEAFDLAQAQYRALPEEADAFHVGDAVTARLKDAASA